MPRACVLLANGFEEIEAITAIDVLRRAGVEVDVLGVGDGTPTGAHGVAVRADQLLGDAAGAGAGAKVGGYDAVILPGGMPGASNLRDSPEVQALVREQNAAGRKLAAICAAPIALSSVGVLAGRTVTSYPGFGAELDCGSYVEDPVAVDGNVTTSRGPGTAMSFALSLVEQLAGKGRADELRGQMLIA